MELWSVTYSVAELPRVASHLLEQFGERRVWLFDAPMGAGKTTLISELCHQLGVPASEVSSPTFAIVNVYPTGGGQELYHMDCYRLETEADAAQIGAEEYLESGNYCFVEWPAVLGRILPEEGVVWVRISVGEGGERHLRVLEGSVEPLYDVAEHE